MRKRNKKIFIWLFVFTGLLFFLGVNADEKKIEETAKEIRADEKEINIIKTAKEEQNPFFHGSADLGLIKTVPFHTAPFLKFNFNFDHENKKFFYPGENIEIKSQISYSDNQTGVELNKIQQICLSDHKKNGGREEDCDIPKIYFFPKLESVSILTQIWREDSNADARKKGGDFLVDSFYGLENTTFAVDESKEVTIKWKIPADISPGKYYASFFINQYKSFTLFGFPVNVFSPYLRFDFEVAGDKDSPNGIVIDKNNIKINEENYSQVLPVPALENTELVDFKVPITNFSNDKEPTTVIYRLQRWTEEDPKEIVTEKKESFSLNPQEVKTLTFSFSPKDQDSFDNLEITVLGNNSQSKINIHFSILDLKRGVIRFLGVGTDKLTGSTAPIVCLRNANWQGDFNGKLLIDFIDEKNTNVKQWQADGIIGSREGLCFSLEKKEIMDLMKKKCVKIKATVTNDKGEKTDEKEISHECTVQNEQANTTDNLGETKSDRSWNFFLKILIVVILFFAFTLALYRNKLKIKYNDGKSK